MKKVVLSLLALSLLAGCATPEVISRTKAMDHEMTCKQISDEIEEANRFEREARGERKVTGKNIAAAVLFWPALLGTYANTEEAIDAAKARRDHVTAIGAQKGCFK